MIESVMQIIDDIGREEDKLLEILIELQNLSEYNYLSKETIKTVAEALDISETKVYGITQFFSMLSTVKRGRNVIQICKSAPCYISGTSNILKIFEELLEVEVGEVTEDGLFSLEYTSCIGACDVAPAVRINNEIYGNLNRGKIFNILSSIKRGEEG